MALRGLVGALPLVRLDAGGVLVRNPWRSWWIGWRALEDVGFGWSLWLRPRGGRAVRALAAPGPSRMQNLYQRAATESGVLHRDAEGWGAPTAPALVAAPGRATMTGVSTQPSGALPEPVVLRPNGVRVLAAVTWVLLVAFAALTARDDLGSALRFAPFAALVALTVYAVFWRPRIDVDPDGVTLANVVRDTRVPFARLEDVRTRFALTLETVEGTFTSWSSPAPGRTSTLSLSRRDTRGFAAMGQPTDLGVSASAAPNTDSGAAALLVRHRWDVWREHGGSPDPVDDGRITRSWDVPLICGFAVLLALSALAAVV